MAIFLKNFTKYCRIAEQKVLKTFEFFNTELDTEWTLLTGTLNSNFEHIDFVSSAEKGNDNWKKILFYDQTTIINLH